MEALEKLFEQWFPDTVAMRRHLHRYPELSFREEKTARFVAERLRNWNIEVRERVGGHGLVGVLRGEMPGPTVALRADMDALPIQDEKQCDYASQIPGVMHACGHDAHTAALLSVARVLGQCRHRLKGTVVFLFQHAEEVSPGGALSMIENGALEGVDVIYGVHLWTPLPSGFVYASGGPVMAAADEFVIDIRGKGGHAGLPHTSVDAVLVGAQTAVNLQSVVSRMVNPLLPCVLSIGSIHGGTGFNVIAETCRLQGTLRTFDPEVRNEVKQRMRHIVEGTCSMFGADFHFEFRDGYPPVVNHEKEAARFHRVGENLFGRDRVRRLEPVMAGEDFAYYLQRVPGCFMFVGAGNEKAGIVYPHHHPKFDIDEKAMLYAARLLAGMALDYMENEGK